MATRTTTGKVKVGLALEPDTYQLLQQLATGPRAMGGLIAELVRAEAARRQGVSTAQGEQLQALSRRLVLLQEQERRALSRELHDTSGQSMSALKLGLAALARSKDASDDTRTRVDWLLHLADTVTDDLHRLALDLRPAALDRYGLVPALEQLLTEFRREDGRTVSFAAPDLGDLPERLPGEVETALYRIAQESLTNIKRHASAASVSVTLALVAEGLALAVQDDGAGFDVEQTLHGGRLGLLGMRERAEMLGGSLRIESAPGRGTTIRASVPLRQPEVVAAPEDAGELPLQASPWVDNKSPEPERHLAAAANLDRAKAISEVLVEVATSAQAEADDARRTLEARSAEEAAILESIADGLVVYDADGRIVRMNAAAEAMLGLSAESRNLPVKERAPSSRPLHLDGSPIAYEDLPAVRALRGEVVRDQALIMAVPARASAPLHVSASAAPIIGPDGRVTGCVAVLRDIEEAYRNRIEREGLLEEQRRQRGLLEQRVAERTAELSQQAEQLELLREIDRSILLARAPAEIAQVAIEKVQGATGTVRAAVHLFEATTDTAEALAVAGAESEWTPVGGRGPASDFWGIDEIRAGRPFTVSDIAALPDDDWFKPRRLQEGVRSVTLIPMVVSGRALGALVTHHRVPGGLAAEDLSWVTHVADSLAVAIQSAQLREKLEASQAQLQALSRRLVERQELERAYVADRLYNEAAQVLAALRMQAGVLARDRERASPEAAWLQAMSANIDRALLELHGLASDLRPAVLDRLGLAAATRQYCREFGAHHALQIDCDVEALHGVRLPTEVETGVYRVLQEALANAWQHATANCVEVSLCRREEKLVLTVHDSGQGFDVAAALKHGSLGLVGMRERADALGGQLEIRSSADTGTQISLEIPV